ncbi:MAG: sulfatase-like hydrolase/transferase [Armatimonadetes bacterium]|nr:sulfatase-like hydrolase/transferase [Armatimonadota bacterium]
MKRREFLKALGASIAMGGVVRMGSEGKQKRLPNLLFVLTDDQAQWAVGAYGNPDIHTPNMDRLAREGMKFTLAMTCPVCSPSRGMILSGLYPHQIGLDDYIGDEDEGIDPKVPLLSEVLKQAGYVTALFGKWHLGHKRPEHHPNRRGFDVFIGSRGGGFANKDPKLEVNGEVRQFSGFAIDVLTEHALQFMRQNRDRPFALFFHTREPHMPYLPVPEEAMRPYEGKRLKVPKVEGVPEERMQQEYRAYYSAVTAVDIALGRLLDELETLGIADDTIVVFMGDNGYMIGQHGLETKGNAWRIVPQGGTVIGTKILGDPNLRRPNMFDLSILVPLIIRWRGVVPPNSVCDELVVSTDLMPTFVDILKQFGCNVPDNLRFEGQSLLPLLRGEKVAWRDAAFLLYDMHHGAVAHMRMVRTKRWKLVLHFEKGGQHELYDLQNDPEEERNLYGDPSVKSVQDELTEMLREWQKKVGDPFASK